MQVELRILRYLPTNLSAAEISRELSVSMNTLKTHMRHVYAKLGAHGSTRKAIEEPPLGALHEYNESNHHYRHHKDDEDQSR